MNLLTAPIKNVAPLLKFLAQNRIFICQASYAVIFHDCANLTPVNGILLSMIAIEFYMIVTEEFFWFIALWLMHNPLGWCCSWLKISELARGIFRRLQHQCLVRDILHQAQGVFPVFVFLTKTRVSWFPIIYKVFFFHWATRPQATCGTLRFQWKVNWVVTFFLGI